MKKKVVLSLLCVPNTTADLWYAFDLAAIAQGWTKTEISDVWKQFITAADYLAALEIIFDYSDTCAEGDDWPSSFDGYDDGPGEKDLTYERVL